MIQHLMPVKGLKDKIVLITGASSGIGYALAGEMARSGAKIVLTARRLDRLNRLKTELKSVSENLVISQCDVTRPEDLELAVNLAHNEFGQFDIAIANAAIPMHGRFDNLTVDNYRKEFETNVFGLLQTCYAALDDLKKTRGTLVLIGSVSSYISSPAASAYAMSKYAVRAFAEAVRSELARYSIKVVLISPGFVNSEIRLTDNEGKFHPEYKDWVPSFLVMPAEKAARQIARAIVKGKREKFITWHGFFSYWIRQHMPFFYFTVFELVNNRFRPEGR
jgi:short-subunit dehydrogenase